MSFFKSKFFISANLYFVFFNFFLISLNATGTTLENKIVLLKFLLFPIIIFKKLFFLIFFVSKS